MKNVILTDFKDENYKNINIDNINNLVNNLNEPLIGNLGEDNYNSYSSFFIKNIIFKNKKIYGDIEFFDNKNGNMCRDFLKRKFAKLEIYAMMKSGNSKRFFNLETSTYEWFKINDEVSIHKIITWNIVIK